MAIIKVQIPERVIESAGHHGVPVEDLVRAMLSPVFSVTAVGGRLLVHDDPADRMGSIIAALRAALTILLSMRLAGADCTLDESRAAFDATRAEYGDAIDAAVAGLICGPEEEEPTP